MRQRRLFCLLLIAVISIGSISVWAQEQSGVKALFYDPTSGANMRPSFGTGGSAPATQPASGGSSASYPAGNYNTGLSYSVELIYPDSAESYRVNASRTFRSGERIRVHFTANYDGYLFVMQQGTSGVRSLLFPSQPGTQENFLQAGASTAIPRQGWFRFDQRTGLEQLFAVFISGRSDPSVLQGATSPAVARSALESELSRMVVYYTSGGGGKDLIAEEDNSFFTANAANQQKDLIADTGNPFPWVGAPIDAPYPMIGPGYQQVAQTPLPPATYVVNQAQGQFAQPVVVSIMLKHQ